MPTNLRYGLAAALVTFFVLLFSCHRFHIDLIDGYQLTRVAGKRVSVTDSARGDLPVIRGNVEQYAFSAPYITGYASSNHVSAGTNPVAGYFLMRTDTREILQALSEEEWKKELTRIHWADPPLQKVP